MAVVTVSATATPCLKNPSSLLATSSFPISSSTSCRTSTGFLPCALSATRKRRGLLHQSFALKNEFLEATDSDGAELLEEIEQPGETLLYSISPLPLLFVGALPGGIKLNPYALSFVSCFTSSLLYLLVAYVMLTLKV